MTDLIERVTGQCLCTLYGTITSIDEAAETASVTLDSGGSMADVPIFYHCQDGSRALQFFAFTAGSQVKIISVNDGTAPSAANSFIVGFRDGNRRSCGTAEYIYIRYGNYAMIWDSGTNDHPPDIQGVQPYTDCLSWLAGRTETTIGEPYRACFWTIDDYLDFRLRLTTHPLPSNGILGQSQPHDIYDWNGSANTAETMFNIDLVLVPSEYNTSLGLSTHVEYRYFAVCWDWDVIPSNCRDIFPDTTDYISTDGNHNAWIGGWYIQSGPMRYPLSAYSEKSLVQIVYHTTASDGWFGDRTISVAAGCSHIPFGIESGTSRDPSIQPYNPTFSVAVQGLINEWHTDMETATGHPLFDPGYPDYFNPAELEDEPIIEADCIHANCAQGDSYWSDNLLVNPKAEVRMFEKTT